MQAVNCGKSMALAGQQRSQGMSRRLKLSSFVDEELLAGRDARNAFQGAFEGRNRFLSGHLCDKGSCLCTASAFQLMNTTDTYCCA